jgi:prevent-host-death family protein
MLWHPMKTLPLRQAKAALSAVIEAAEHGEATTITKHGRPAAVVVPVEDARRIYPTKRPGFVDLLREIPHAIETDRDQSPLREVDL